MMTKINLGIITASLLALFCSGAQQAFLAPPQHAGPPLVQHAVTNRAFQGISSMTVTPGGRLWAVWYAGVTPGEDHNNYVAVSTSGDDGKTWNEVLIVDPDGPGPIRTFDPEIWMAPDGTLHLFWAQTINHDLKKGGVWSMTTTQPENEQAEWQPPQRLTDGVMMCKPIVLTTGEWVLPAATWSVDNSAKMVVSSDQGKTWSVRGACNVPKDVRNCDEHMFIERRDGSIWLLVRTKYGIGESISTDRGKTWPELTPSAIVHPTARFFISRLASGNLLLVKHGPLTERTGRSHLTAFISKDDGISWEGGLMLDERSGVSYPDGQQAADGTIYITYDYKRTTDRNILFTTFKEEDVLAGKDVTGKVRLRQMISKASGGLERKKNNGKPKTVKSNADGAKLNPDNSGAWKCQESYAFRTGSKLFSDRAYTLAENQAALSNANFLRVKMDGNKTLDCSKTGMLYILTPAPDRNRDSVTKELTAQGFKKVAMPEIRLFAPGNPGNYCTLYQKSCTAGDTITFGKWGLPIYF